MRERAAIRPQLPALSQTGDFLWPPGPPRHAARLTKAAPLVLRPTLAGKSLRRSRPGALPATPGWQSASERTTSQSCGRATCSSSAGGGSTGPTSGAGRRPPALSLPRIPSQCVVLSIWSRSPAFIPHSRRKRESRKDKDKLALEPASAPSTDNFACAALLHRATGPLFLPPPAAPAATAAASSEAPTVQGGPRRLAPRPSSTSDAATSSPRHTPPTGYEPRADSSEGNLSSFDDILGDIPRMQFPERPSTQFPEPVSAASGATMSPAELGALTQTVLEVSRRAGVACFPRRLPCGQACSAASAAEGSSACALPSLALFCEVTGCTETGLITFSSLVGFRRSTEGGLRICKTSTALSSTSCRSRECVPCSLRSSARLFSTRFPLLARFPTAGSQVLGHRVSCFRADAQLPVLSNPPTPPPLRSAPPQRISRACAPSSTPCAARPPALARASGALTRGRSPSSPSAASSPRSTPLSRSLVRALAGWLAGPPLQSF